MNWPQRRRRSVRRPAAIVVQTLGAIVAAAAVLYGGRALRLELPVVFRDAPTSAFPSPFRHQLQIVLRALPPGASVLHLSSVKETWYSRMWERALYPRNAVVSFKSPDPGPATLRRARDSFGARFAISLGEPPPYVGYAWRVPLGMLPGLTQESWFGELGP